MIAELEIYRAANILLKEYGAEEAGLMAAKSAIAPKQMMTVEVSKSPQDFTEQVRKETEAWGTFLREAKIKVE